MKKKNTRQRLIEVGAELIHLKGFNHTGLQEILKVSGVPKGSFYFYFASKEEFGLAIIDHYDAHFAAIAEEVLGPGGDAGPLQRLRSFLEVFRGYFEAHGFSRGCPVGNLAQEMGDLSEAFSRRLEESIARMAAPLKRVLNEARDLGEIPSRVDPDSMAFFIISAWHGSLLRMKVSRDSGPLLIFEKTLFDHLLK